MVATGLARRPQPTRKTSPGSTLRKLGMDRLGTWMGLSCRGTAPSASDMPPAYENLASWKPPHESAFDACSARGLSDRDVASEAATVARSEGDRVRTWRRARAGPALCVGERRFGVQMQGECCLTVAIALFSDRDDTENSNAHRHRRSRRRATTNASTAGRQRSPCRARRPICPISYVRR